MKSCRKFQHMMVDALYQELSPRRRQAFEAHLVSCTACAAEHEQLSWTLGVMDRRQAPEMDPAYWKGYWARLSRRLESGQEKTRLPDWRAWLPPVVLPVRPAWVAAAATVLLVATGVFIGRSIYMSQPGGNAGAVQAGVFDPAVIADFNGMLSRYLGQSRSLLLGLDNFDTGRDDPALMDFPQQQMISQELLVQGQEIRRHAVASADPRISYLVDEIERVLLQLANSEDEDLEWTIRLVQEGVEQNAILVKINLTEQEQSEKAGGEKESTPAVNKSSLLI